MNRKAGIALLCLCLACVIVGVSGSLRDRTQEKERTGETVIRQETEAASEETVLSSADVTPLKYVLLDADGQVTVYHSDLETVYMSTGINSAQLPETVREHLSQGIGFTTEEELFAFLESYSS